MDRLLLRVVAERRASGQDAGDLLSMLLSAQDDTGAGMSDVQLRDEVMTLFVGGHETTVIALTWTWQLLGGHPEVLEQMQAELDEVLAGRVPTTAELPALVVLERVLRESMRLYPVYAFDRKGVGPHRYWRRSGPSRNGRTDQPVGPPPECGVVRRSGRVPPGSVARSGTTLQQRLPAVRWRATGLHRQRVRLDGDDAGDGRHAAAGRLRADRV